MKKEIITQECSCGCGKLIHYRKLRPAELKRQGNKRYAPGHQNRGKIHTPEHIAKSTHKLEKNGRWKGGITTTRDGYIRIKVPNHPFNNKGYVLEHRLVMEKTIGRYLKPNEVIHHINHIKTDNRPQNLIILNQSQHSILDHTGRTYKKKGKWFICEHCGEPFYLSPYDSKIYSTRFCSWKCRIAK